MSKILPLMLMIAGIAAGGGAGFMLKPTPEECLEENCDVSVQARKDTELDDAPEEANYVRLKNQFVVPVVKGDHVKSMVVLGISLEVKQGTEDVIYSREPKIRDAFLRVLFDHAHIGGFDGTFTETERLSDLRIALLEVAQSVIGNGILDILITDIARQEF